MRFTKPSKRRLPKEARSMPYKAGGDLKLFKCWNCGFICDAERDESSGSKAGDNHMVYALPAFGGLGLDGTIKSTEVGKECVLMKQDANGDAATVQHIYTSVVTRGCPMCGTTNYKG